MDAIAPLIENSLICGGIYSLFMSALVLGALRYNPEVFYDDYPEPIRQHYGPISSTGQRDRKVMVGLLIIGLLAVPLALVWQIKLRLGGEMPFLSAAIAAYIILGMFQLVDLVLIDGLLGMVIDPRWLRLPGTEHLTNHWTIEKHLRDFAKAMLILLPLAAVLGGVSLLL
jgi:hypothetical protein